MACPHCGEHQLHKSDGALRCCRCGRPRHDLEASPLLSLLQRHGLLLATGLLCPPLALGMAALHGLERSQPEQAAESQPSRPAKIEVSQLRTAEP
jgi:hypothetical protein